MSSAPSARGRTLGRILITGGAGFIGGHLAASLASEGHEVDLLDSLARGRRDGFLSRLLASPRVRLFERDLTRGDSLSDLDLDYSHLFHLAAIVGVENVLHRPYCTLRDNVRLLDTALDFARRQRSLERFVFASTSEVYAGSLQHLALAFPTPETAALALPGLDQPRTSYMLSKIYGEAMVQHAGLPFTIVRPHNFYGPRMGLSHVIPQLLEKAHRAAREGSIEVYSVDHRRTFCYIDDAVELIIRASTLPAGAGRTLNVGSQSPEVAIRDLAAVVVRTVGKPLSIEARPATPGSPTRRCPDMSATSEITGYRAKVGLEEGVRRTWEWYRPMVFEGGEAEVAR